MAARLRSAAVLLRLSFGGAGSMPRRLLFAMFLFLDLLRGLVLVHRDEGILLGSHDCAVRAVSVAWRRFAGGCTFLIDKDWTSIRKNARATQSRNATPGLTTTFTRILRLTLILIINFNFRINLTVNSLFKIVFQKFKKLKIGGFVMS